jgi:[ribosomal protein S5]-alanine N-acetyltransferase
MVLGKVVISLVKQIYLINLDHETLHLLQSRADRFCAEHGVSIGSNTAILLDVVAQTTKLMTTVGGDPKWFGYLTIDTITKVIIGTCAFKGPPSKDGSVEIAYFTFPEFERNGYATAMASALIEIASSSPAVEKIIAHTLPETNASTRILQKVGMTFVGEVIDPEDGRVWRWTLDKVCQT